MTGNSSDLSDDIVPEVPQHSSIERQFAPWHKVRKEFVRKEQWNKFIIRYAARFLRRELQQLDIADQWSADEETEVPDSIKIDMPLKCLVIPGDDLLDIRSLYRDTEHIHCFIRYLGFNDRQGSEQKGTRVQIAHNDVTSLDRVSKDSIVLPDRFQVVAKPNSQGCRYLKELGPFHVVNLDLCDSLFPTQNGDLTSYYEALHAISAYQMKEMATPWMLFITTEVAPNEVDESQFDKLCEPTKLNLRTHSEFESAFSDIIPLSAFNSDAKNQVDFSKLNEKQLVDLFGVAIGKALLKFCSTADPNWKVSMLGSHIYGINESLGVSMLSLAFQFTPISQPPQDTTGISSLEIPSPKPFDELELAVRLVNSVKGITDIDDILAGNSELHTKLLNSSADLLAEAGYDREDYIQWVMDGEQTSFD